MASRRGAAASSVLLAVATILILLHGLFDGREHSQSPSNRKRQLDDEQDPRAQKHRDAGNGMNVKFRWESVYCLLVIVASRRWLTVNLLHSYGLGAPPAGYGRRINHQSISHDALVSDQRCPSRCNDDAVTTTKTVTESWYSSIYHCSGSTASSGALPTVTVKYTVTSVYEVDPTNNPDTGGSTRDSGPSAFRTVSVQPITESSGAVQDLSYRFIFSLDLNLASTRYDALCDGCYSIAQSAVRVNSAGVFVRQSSLSGLGLPVPRLSWRDILPPTSNQSFCVRLWHRLALSGMYSRLLLPPLYPHARA
ncbi:MAG: hypothetical protein M1833_003822 [Piccolia ochrophora]|nr:MAG: hypothetical protein M1833_003822 [Piccolia ochrophora]